ncbi:hypothetical protein [Solidesulfovibrio sp.]|uniref:hypothetical protein n=1 Tax=Solidesulfovibrio sp. TaxID=2910990 RepID=UPI00260C7E3C|nr:hypothetical protein [Solidesulfovibrio sp.]
MPADPLENIPDLRAPEDVVSWLAHEAGRLVSLRFDGRDDREVFSLAPGDDALGAGALGPGRDERFVLAMLLADWACYADPAHREEYAHLRQTFSVYPKGFRLWLGRVGETCVPVGYTAFHPIARETYLAMRERPESLISRKQIRPEPESPRGAAHLYLYNLCILGPFQATPASRRLVKTLAADMAATGARALAAVAVSPAGRRVVERFGMRSSGFMTHDGHREMVYVSEEAPNGEASGEAGEHA